MRTLLRAFFDHRLKHFVTIGDRSTHCCRNLSKLMPQIKSTVLLLPETVRSGFARNPKPPAHEPYRIESGIPVKIGKLTGWLRGFAGFVLPAACI